MQRDQMKINWDEICNLNCNDWDFNQLVGFDPDRIDQKEKSSDE